jgi:1-deoxy-D-xylulose-5-phosphate synthase
MSIGLEDFPLLRAVNLPADLRALPEDRLGDFCKELREYLIRSVATRGGHFAAGLGTVELTVALHYVFETPHDRLVWDVGHQAYPHKVLTGRRDRLDTIKQNGGLAPFPSRAESEYDTFGVGHSSTSISAALGMAVAAELANEERKVVAIIGDGALTGGMAWEALLNAGARKNTNLLVVLNDNDMSISENVGALSNYFAKVLSGRMYSSLRSGGKKFLKPMPTMWELARRSEEMMKGMVLPGTIFEEFDFNYIGPMDGHDIKELVKTLRNMRSLKGPQLLHVATRKGKGYDPAEKDPIKWHGPGPFDPKSGTIFKEKVSGPTYSQVFGEWLCDMAARDEKVVGITPAMREGSGMVEYSKKFPQRYFDVAIAEQHAVTFAAGLACEGLKPVVAIYSTFLQRAYDQLIHDVALQNLDVTFALDRAGLVGADGATHAGNYDLAYLRCIPNMVVMAASDENECRQMLSTGFHYNGPAAIRYPRGAGVGATIDPALSTIEIGKGEVKHKGKGVAILAFGSMVAPSLAAGVELGATVANMRFVKPLDVELVKQLAAGHEYLVTVEEGCIMGGAGAAVAEALAAEGIAKPLMMLGLPDRFIDHGDPAVLLASVGLDAKGIVKSIRERVGKAEPRLVVNNT